MEWNEKDSGESRGVILQRDRLEESQVERFMEAINRLTRVPLRSDQVYIRSMYLCSDRLCEQDWGQFSQRALEQIGQLVIGQSVIVGHDRSRLQIARFFHAEVTTRETETLSDTGKAEHWVRAWFYWLRETKGAKDLQLNIDGGIYREVSISWRYRNAACTICGDSIRQCQHVPGREYDGQRCTFIIEDVEEVLEGSIVYKGAETKTGFEHQASHRRKSVPQSQASQPQTTIFTSTEISSITHILDRQSREIRALVLISDEPRYAQTAAFLSKQLGLSVWIKSETCEHRIGGVDILDETHSGTVDLIWIRVSNPNQVDWNASWWRQLRGRAKSCIWETHQSSDDPRGFILERVFPDRLWQLKSVGCSPMGEPLELIREEP